MQKYDDVGSLPLPEGVDKKKFSKALSEQEDWAMKICQESMKMKIDKGIEVPCYPQLRNMVDQFIELVKNPEIIEEPYLIKTENAILPELIALDKSSLKLPPLKVCITGPLELSAAEFGNKIHNNILFNIAESLNRFIERAERMENIDIEVVSIDEPSLGINSQLLIDDEELIKAWDTVGKSEKDVQIHLHSPLFYETACKSTGIDIIDIGTAGTPDNLEMINPRILEDNNKGLRIGISRTDVHTMGSEFNEKNKVNIWQSKIDWSEFLNQIDPPTKIADRIEKAFKRFNGLIKYFGPDCGLGGTPSEELAGKILENTKSGIDLFREWRKA